MTSHEDFNALIVEIFKLHGLLIEHGNNLTSPYGQTSARWQVLGVIDKSALSVPQIAEIMGLTRQGVQKTADLLAQDGLAKFIENPEHKKSKLLSISKKGLSTLQKIEAAQNTWANKILKELSTKKINEVNNFLSIFTEILIKKI